MQKKQTVHRWTIWLAACALTLVSAISTWAENTFTPDNPYVVLISRNVFGLVKPALSATPTNLPPPILPTVKIQGVTTILDCRQVLLEISGPKTVQPPAKPIAVVMREGEREGEVEVLTINERRGTAIIRNQGIIQTLTMGERLD